jgi:hypothetical protein
MLGVICGILLFGCLCISGFDVEFNMVIFWFVDEGKVKRFVSLYVFEFIDCLVRFIADKNFELILV